MSFTFCKVEKVNKVLQLKAFMTITAHTAQCKTEHMQINHKDENKANNCIDNLELMTNKENCSYGTRNARISKAMKRYRAKQRAMAAC